MNSQIFREYDIRGVVGKDLDDDGVALIARAIGTYWVHKGVKRVCLGMDARLSSPGFSNIMAHGFTQCGLDVIDLGMVPTPVMYFSLFKLDVGGGIEITGSHNPKDDNGFKIALGHSTIYGGEIQKIREIMEAGIFANGSGRVKPYDISQEYMDDIIHRIDIKPKHLKVVIDPGNGVAGPFAMPIFKALGIDTSGICMEPDGNFPNHHPDPTISSGIQMLRDEVLGAHADLGIGFDGDADRIGVIDSRGKVIYGDMITCILAKAVLEKNPGEKILGEVKCSKVLFDEVKKAGGIPIMGKVGHSLMKARLMEEKAALAGEMSGHIFFVNRWYGFDDAIYAACRLLEILSCVDNPQTIFDALPVMVNTPEIRFECKDRIKVQVVERFASWARTGYEKIVDIDGIRFENQDGWGLVRPSNTQPVIVMRFEAKDAGTLEAMQTDTRNRLKMIMDKIEPPGM
ncbi:MAG: phosphomannomutase/phosphoglucomutase [Thermodesulfobacteriota bacterium]|nr:phosphomannomutase/phosphoglucomutase [Thermodesulfobacteriota bacterium]